MLKKMKIYFFDILDMSINGFFMFFLLFYIAKYGLSNLVIQETSKLDTIFNIGVWYVLVMYCVNGFFIALNRILKGGKLKWKKKD